MMNRLRKYFLLMTASGSMFVLSGGCLPDNVLVDTAGAVTSGLIISAINLFLAPTGLAI
ncbi:MAG: hypothetical protein ACYTBZ_08995 [Planctomycetota bacterium]|jgi:hypothetical protein